MLVEKQILRQSGDSYNIKFSLSNNGAKFAGSSQEIDNLIETENEKNINEFVDGEKFRVLPIGSCIYNYQFFDGTNFVSTFTGRTFTDDEVNNNEEVFIQSFFINQLYTTTKTDTQIRIHSGYINISPFTVTDSSSIFTIGSNDEAGNLYITNDYIDSLSGITTSLFMKLSFYNAKTGAVQLFSNENLDTDLTEDKLYFNVSFNPTAKTYTCNEINNTFLAKEINNTGFTATQNENHESFPQEKTNFPSGTKFLSDGTYIE